MTFSGGAFKERGTETRQGEWQGTSESEGKDVKRSLRAAISLQDLWNQVQLPDLLKSSRQI